MLDVKWAKEWLQLSAKIINAHRDELIELDRVIGDGDHGENLDRGFQAVAAGLADSTFTTPAEVFKFAAQTLLSTVGGASGPLLGTAFLRAAKAAKAVDSPQLSAADSLQILQAALMGIQERGKAVPGEKTMVDAWSAALAAAQAAAQVAGQNSNNLPDALSASPASQVEPCKIWEAAAAGAAKGAAATADLCARKGRASYLGERSIGHLDPGAVSSAYILAAAAQAAQVAQADQANHVADAH